MGSAVNGSQARMARSGCCDRGGYHGEDGSRTVFHAPERGRLGNRRLMLAGLVGACALLALVVGVSLGACSSLSGVDGGGSQGAASEELKGTTLRIVAAT